MHLILSFFDQILGPKIHLASHPYLAGYIQSSVTDLMDIKTEKGFFEYNYYSDEYDVFLANYYFSIPSEWSRGKIERLMLTVVVDPLQDPKAFRPLLEKYAKIIQDTPNIYKGFFLSNKKKIDEEIQEDALKIKEIFEQMIVESEQYLTKVVLGEILVVGLSYVGKTSYLNAINQKAFNANIKPTLGIQLTKVVIENYKVNAVDVGGQTKLKNLYQKLKFLPSGIVFMVDVSFDENRVKESCEIFNEIIHHNFGAGKDSPLEKKIPVLIIANKIDLNKKFDENKIKSWLKLDSFGLKYRTYTTSVLKNIRVFSSFRWLITKLIETAD